MTDRTARIGWYEVRLVSSKAFQDKVAACTCGLLVSDTEAHIAYHKKHGEICEDKR